MRRKALILLLIVLPTVIFAQRFGRKMRYRYEWVYGVGASNFLGELGGADQVGTNFAKDLEFVSTRPTIHIGIRYQTSRYTAVKGNLFMGILKGGDNLTQETYRKNRNLQFRSPVIELSGQFEGYILREDVGHIYKIRNASGMKRFNFRHYGFIGIGAFFFNPQALYNGTWVNLQPLGTEGQNFTPGKKPYSRFNIAVPLGIGTKVGLDRKWSLGLEIGIRKTFTDYIDDVSTEYADNNLIQANAPAGSELMAGYLADPSLNLSCCYDPATEWNNTAPGLQRGDPTDKDSYMFAMITASYKVLYKRRSRSKF